ncbi:hypothetical protein SEEE2651_21338 [Salmonella enterica subsp. enterica serovar Enteritidis str. 76-2651]|nr:hypothetical protein SEEM0055_17245 [Salmonella enterica subsp. enterica serovar Montevideo str. MB110209-0055]ELO71452.1 hypothetical protein SEEE2651_21338 [Salmonella enterica subsp. enterica serovar Enteritidis str. 76-2651]
MYAQSLFGYIPLPVNVWHAGGAGETAILSVRPQVYAFAIVQRFKSGWVYRFQASGNSLRNLSLHRLHCLFNRDCKCSLIGRTMTFYHRAAQS